MKAEQPSNGEQEQTTASVVSAVASRLAGMVLEETLRNGGTVEIPSLGIVIGPEHLRPKPEKLRAITNRHSLHTVD